MKAVILCAGMGTRLGKLTRNLPKPMLLINGKPLLEYTLQHLKRLGIRDFVINLHYIPDAIKGYFRNGSKFDINIEYSYEKSLLGTAGALKYAESYLSNDKDFLVLYGDVLTNQNINELIRFHHQKSAIATLMLHKRKLPTSVVELDRDNKVLSFVERPSIKEIDQLTGRDRGQYWVNSGVQILSKKIFKYIIEREKLDLPRDIYAPLAHIEPIYGFPLTGFRIAIDSPQRYHAASEAVKRGLFDNNRVANQ